MRFLLLSVVSLAACGGAVASENQTAEPVARPEPEWTSSPSCEAVRASCGGDPATVVLGHASGLAELEGARVEFAVRYLLEEGAGAGLDVPHGVALGRTRVSGGAFATCVCVPHGANMYPQVAAVVYASGTTGVTSRDVARAMFSERYAVGSDEEVSSALNRETTDLQKEAAVAAMVDRTAKVTIELTDDGGRMLHAGLIADERPLAPQVATASAAFGPATFSWTMPGRAWPSERVAFFIDDNGNGKCDDGDRGAVIPFGAKLRVAGAWLTGTALSSVCNAVPAGVSRE